MRSKYQDLGNLHMLWSIGCINCNIGNILTSQRFNTCI